MFSLGTRVPDGFSDLSHSKNVHTRQSGNSESFTGVRANCPSELETGNSSRRKPCRRRVAAGMDSRDPSVTPRKWPNEDGWGSLQVCRRDQEHVPGIETSDQNQTLLLV